MRGNWQILFTVKQCPMESSKKLALRESCHCAAMTERVLFYFITFFKKIQNSLDFSFLK